MTPLPRAGGASRPARRGRAPSPTPSRGSTVKAFQWSGTSLLILEQRDLPHKTRFIPCRTHKQVADCIRQMSVRGAPAIGCVAAYGVALAAREKKFRTWEEMRAHLDKTRETLAQTRPTAVNLFWALDHMRRLYERLHPDPKNFMRDVSETLLQEAHKITEEDHAACVRMGDFGAELFPNNTTVLTHCNAGALATAGHGTSLGVIRSAHKLGKIKKVLVDETRPYLQGARLTAWECHAEGIPYEIITDNMAGHLMKTENVGAVIVGADRIAANGDTANKIGTYALAILARHHNIPFYVAAPFSTIDLNTSTGDQIPIEERSVKEVVEVNEKSIAPRGSRARHPAFDVTPHELITAIITERGVVRPPYRNSLLKSSRPNNA